MHLHLHSDLWIELEGLAIRFAHLGIPHNVRRLTNADAYGLLLYLRRAAAEVE
jgi:hypothetical protein